MEKRVAMTELLDSDLPWPGDELVYRVTGVVYREWFYESGRRSAADVEAALALLGKRLGSFSTVLDFGCGCGRILLWLADRVKTSSLHGVDIDERAVEWVSENLPYVTAKVNQPVPPLDYPDGYFDLVYNHSVFTHIDESYQDLWLAELRRVTKPGGILLLSVHGETAFREFEAASGGAGGNPAVIRERLSREGIAFIGQDPWVGSAFPDYYHTTFHAPWYVFQHWGQFFRIRAFIARGSLDRQDFVLLERVPDDEPLPESLGPIVASTTQPAAQAVPAPEGAPPPGPPGSALERARAELAAGPAVDSPTAYGAAARVARTVVLRALRHYADYQRRLQTSIVDALGELDAAVRAEPIEGLTSRESQIRLWDALRRHGERVNRLEADLWDAIRSRPGGPDAGGAGRQDDTVSDGPPGAAGDGTA